MSCRIVLNAHYDWRVKRSLLSVKISPVHHRFHTANRPPLRALRQGHARFPQSLKRSTAGLIKPLLQLPECLLGGGDELFTRRPFAPMQSFQW
jgi:hypothetical protein